ncbi:hypothetical protein [Pseudomonas nicosulfuronedens]
MNSGTNSQVQVACIDVWRWIFFAGALLLLTNQVQLQMQVSQASSAPVAYVPSAFSTPGLDREGWRYPQPARNQAQVLLAPQTQAQPMARAQGGWVF